MKLITALAALSLIAAPAHANSAKECAAKIRTAQSHWFFNETGISYGSEMANSKASQRYVNRLRAMGMEPSTPRPGFEICG